ncbi:hypothetical protein CW731_04195 [Polaribacter sp. ALD11]|uniref:DUF2141 domain-containing protein n=1 Tax=Polaribacter sp. ALD11 TaxID=2058137 RepID=UPI000C3106D4|nr:DUF2141 domain-containing protein [Polaribacter sp. ALD11]AUC84549.1 hypothetical protein CW731_04195 [Polaribacter sp. ALD11]
MKILVSILVLAILSITSTLTAQDKTITVTISNINSDEGKVGFALYNKDNFMRTPIESKEGVIKNGKTTIIFGNVKPGSYAVTCYHDKNSNGKMDFSANRMPLEDYGASNNVIAFAPPTFEGAKFTVIDKNVSLEIKF